MQRRAWWCALLVLAFAARAFGDADDGSAREHYNKGTTAYDLGRFADAAREFEAAYEAKHDPAFLFNLAQSYRFAGAHDKALLAYKSFLRNLPDAPQREQVEKTIAELQALVNANKAAASAPPAMTLSPAPAPSTTIVAAPPPPRVPVYKRWWLWTGVGVVVAAGVAVGVAFAVPKNAAYPGGTQMVTFR